MRRTLPTLLIIACLVAATWAAKGGNGKPDDGQHSCRHTKFAERWEALQNADRVAIGVDPMRHDCALGDLAELIVDNVRFNWNLTMDDMMAICGVTERPLIVGLLGSCRTADCWWFVVNRLYPEDLRIILADGATHCGEAQWSGNVLIACYGGDFSELIGE